MNIGRIQRDIEMIAGCTETPGAGATRPTFSSAWRAARDYVIAELEGCNCRVRIDAAGNVHARPFAVSFETPAWLSGSHLDTVPHGGNYDGVVGVVAALEVLRWSREAQKVLPLELVIWADEEGTTFGLGMLGSRACAGTISAQELANLKNSADESFVEAGVPHGVIAEKIDTDHIDTSKIVGLIEIHIEQGPGLWNAGHSVAIVNAIAGRRQYSLSISGNANHAGSTSMRDRHDALAGAAETILFAEKLARDLARDTVVTVGQISCRPNALNVIPEQVDMTIDFRSPSMEMLARGDQMLQKHLEAMSGHRGLRFVLRPTEFQAPITLDDRVVARLHKAATRVGVAEIPQTASGALHDAAILAPLVPTAMLFVASRDGISHNPDEFSRAEDIAIAATILAEAVRNRSLD